MLYFYVSVIIIIILLPFALGFSSNSVRFDRQVWIDILLNFAIKRKVHQIPGKKEGKSMSKHESKVLKNLTATCPSSMTRIRSESMTVCNRWAIVNTVQSLNWVRMVSWIMESVL